MKQLKYILILSALSLFTLGSCHKGPVCPAYNSAHNSRTNAHNPNNAHKTTGDNKKDIEAKRKAALKGPSKKPKKSYSLYPKWMGIKSR